MVGLYVGLYKYSCDMCGAIGERPIKTVIHQEGSKADICAICYGKCQAFLFPEFADHLTYRP